MADDFDNLNPESDVAKRIDAFADGQLAPAEMLAFVERLTELAATDRDRALRYVREAQRVVERSRAALRDRAGAPSAALRERIESLVAIHPAARAETASDEGDSTSSTRAASTVRNWWAGSRGLVVGLATAAGVAIGITSAALWMTSSAPPVPVAQRDPATTTSSVALPGQYLLAVARTHANCSRLGRGLHTATFEETDRSLAAVVRGGLRAEPSRDARKDAPDLRSIGFRFVGAGPCDHAGPGVVHLLYRSTIAGSNAALSLFVQADTGRFDQLAAGRVYRVASGPATFPTLAWRHAGATYFLLADDEQTSMVALQTLYPTSSDEILNATAIAMAR